MSQQPPAPTSISVPPVPEHTPHQPPGQPGWATAIDVGKLWVGAASAGASYLTVFVVTLASVLLSFAGVAASTDDNLLPQSGSALPGQSQVNVWSQVGQMAAQLIAMAHLGRLGTDVDGTFPFVGAIRGDASAYVVPLATFIVCVLSLYLFSRKAEQKMPSISRPQLLSQALITGAVYSMLINVMALVAAVRYPAFSDFRLTPIAAAGFWPVAVAFCLGAGVSFLARNSVAAGRFSAIQRPLWIARINLPVIALAIHTLLFAAVAIPAILIVSVVSYGWLGLLMAPLSIFNAVGYTLVAGHLGGLWLHTGTSQILGSSNNWSQDHVIFGLGADIAGGSAAGAVWSALVLALLCTVAAGTAVLLRRGLAENRKASTWFGVPAAFLIFGLCLLPLLSSSFRYNLPGMASGEYSVSPVWWSPVVFLVWGVLVELCARFISPYLLPFVPARLQGAARLGTVAARPVPVTAAEPEALPLGLDDQRDLVPPTAKTLSPAGKKRAKITLIALGATAVIVAGGLVAVNVAKTSSSPDKLVGEYVQALVDGDAEKALLLADPDVPNEDRTLLTNAVYGAAAKRIDGFSILSTDVTGESASVLVELRQDGRKSEDTYMLVKDHPSLLDDNWKLQTSGLQVLTLTADVPVDGFSVNGVVAGPPDSGPATRTETLTLSAFPGEYTVTLPETEKFLTAKAKRTLVTIGTRAQAPEGVDLEVTASEALHTEVRRQVEAAWAECAKSTEMKPKGCPFRGYAFGDTRSVKWSIVSKPEYSLERSYSGGWRLRSETDGKAEVSYEENSSYNKDKPDWKPRTDSLRFGAHGEVNLDSEKVLLKVASF